MEDLILLLIGCSICYKKKWMWDISTELRMTGKLFKYVEIFGVSCLYPVCILEDFQMYLWLKTATTSITDIARACCVHDIKKKLIRHGVYIIGVWGCAVVFVGFGFLVVLFRCVSAGVAGQFSTSLGPKWWHT